MAPSQRCLGRASRVLLVVHRQAGLWEASALHRFVIDGCWVLACGVLACGVLGAWQVLPCVPQLGDGPHHLHHHQRHREPGGSDYVALVWRPSPEVRVGVNVCVGGLVATGAACRLVAGLVLLSCWVVGCWGLVMRSRSSTGGARVCDVCEVFSCVVVMQRPVCDLLKHHQGCWGCAVHLLLELQPGAAEPFAMPPFTVPSLCLVNPRLLQRASG